jgi:hypothetical protein
VALETIFMALKTILGIRNGFFRLGFVGFSVGHVGFPTDQIWRQREEDEVLGSARSPFLRISVRLFDGLAVEDVIGEVREKLKKKKKKKNQSWGVHEGEAGCFVLILRLYIFS